MKKFRISSGFTIIEVLIVVVIIGIMSALAAPQFGKSIERLEFKTKTKDLISTLRLARSYSITEKDQFGVYFNVDNSAYILFKDINNPSAYTYEAGADSIISADTLNHGGSYLYSTFGTGSIIFQPNGSASESGYIYMGEYSDDNVSYSSVTVLAATGRTKMEYIKNY